MRETLRKALLPYCNAAAQEEGIWQELKQAESARVKIDSPPGLPTGLALLKGELLLLLTSFEEG